MKKMLRVVSVLGTPYTIFEGTTIDFPDLSDCDGYCDTTIKNIVVSDMSEAEGRPGAKADLNHYKRKVIRHELIHAILFESGLSTGGLDSHSVSKVGSLVSASRV